MNRRGKITPNQRNQLLQIFLHMGLDEAQRMCVEYGVAPKYAQTVAYTLSLTTTDRRGKEKAYGVDHNDPRWARAIANGSVSA